MKKTNGYAVIDKSLPQRSFRFSVRSNQDILPSSTLSSKYGHFLLQKPQKGNGSDVKLLRKTVNKPVGDITVGLH